MTAATYWSHPKMNERWRVCIWTRELRSYEIEDNLSLADFFKVIREVASDVPDELLNNVSAEFISGDDMGSGRLEFTYWRDETDEEMRARIDRAEATAEQNRHTAESAERATLARLRAKYGE